MSSLSLVSLAEAAARAAVVTGAAGGIGGAVCRRLVADGFAVACLDVREQDVVEVAQDLPGARGYGADVRDAASVREAAGRILDTNLKGPFLTCREFLPAMVAAHDGCIVNIASTAGVRGGRRHRLSGLSHGTG